MKKLLKRTKQCKTCPWKKDSNPYDIPNGYSCELHKDLKHTISNGENRLGGSLRAMACHYSPVGEEEFCVGWLVNQLGVGNNILLRIQMLDYENANEIKLDGEQHERFEDTLPK